VPQTVSTALPEFGDLSLKVEFAPTGQDGKPRGQPSIIYELPTEDFTKCMQEWLLVDLPLDEIAPSKGELRFVADGPKAGSEDFQVLWGQPALYVPRRESHKNVLLIGVDTLRTDAISPTGGKSEITPNIQAFSEGATVFTQAHSQAPWTLPSFASIITGLMPSKAIEAEMGQLISKRTTTVGEYLLPEGLATYTVCSSPWLGPGSGFQQGMEGFSFLPKPTAQIQVEAAMKFIDRSQEMGRDWFCFIHLMDPHTPYQPPERYISLLCDTGYSGEYPTSYLGGVWETGDKKPSQEEIDHERCLYDCEVANVDSALQDLFRLLDEKGLTKDTLIIFCSDHGEEFNEHGGFEHGKTQYEEQVHVPLIVKGPGFPAGRRIDDSVANLDILPTIFRYLGIAQPESIGGIPLQDTINGENKNNQVIFGEETLNDTGLVYSLTWPFKCILDYTTEESTFYNLVNDPGETKDVSTDNPEGKAALLAALDMLIRPETSSFHIWVTGYENKDHRFAGKIRVPGGIEKVQTFLFDPGDTYTVSGDTLDFNISSLVNQPLGSDELAPHGILPHRFLPRPIKHLVITPSPGSDSIDVSVTVDGEISDRRFFPFGNKTMDSSGSAILSLDDFPMVPTLPTPGDNGPDSFILWGVRGTHSEEPPTELDPETLEQLRALGYLGH
jgi:arylsulfatase A-like enzyme